MPSPTSRALPFELQRSWGFASLHPRAGSPAEHLGWGARLYAVAALRGLKAIVRYASKPYGVGGTFASCVVPGSGWASDRLGTAALLPVAGTAAGVASFVGATVGATGVVEFGVSG